MFLTRMKNQTPRYTFGNPFELIDRFIGGRHNAVAGAFPALNIWANEEVAIVTTELPGVKLEDLEITAQGKTIGIKGARKEGGEGDEGMRYLRRERPEGEFSRSIELPFQIDAGRVEAKLANGVLRITLPRAENDKPRKISVNAG